LPTLLFLVVARLAVEVDRRQHGEAGRIRRPLEAAGAARQRRELPRLSTRGRQQPDLRDAVVVRANERQVPAVGRPPRVSVVLAARQLNGRRRTVCLQRPDGGTVFVRLLIRVGDDEG